MSDKLEKARKTINEIDARMAELFVKRMRAAEDVYEYKKQYGLPILDQKRENQLIEKNSALIEDEMLKGYYIDYLKDVHLACISVPDAERTESCIQWGCRGVRPYCSRKNFSGKQPDFLQRF